MNEVDLHGVTGEAAEDWVHQLIKLNDGCVSCLYAESAGIRFFVCMGWRKDRDGDFKLAWKIGLQPSNYSMQSDFDVDFGVPKNHESGEVDDTTEQILLRSDGRVGHCGRHSPPKGYRSWNAFASHIRAEARRIYRLWK